ncbi:MAG: acetate--CoA ligase family protein [Gaiellales bacterium]
MSARRDLRPLFEPRSVLLVGATADTMKWGGWVTKSFGETRHLRDTHFVNLRGGELYGVTALTSIADVDAAIDLAVIVVPAPAVPEAVTQSLALGAKALVIITSGFGETSEEGRVVQEAIVEEVRAAGAVLLGPNCLGLYDDATSLNVYGGTFPSGDLALATQSGNLALEVALLLEHQGLGLTRFASVGNQADLTIGDVIRDFAHHDATRVVGAYVESPRDGAAFADAVREAAARKPVVLFAAGRTAAGAHAAASHTGNLAAESRVLRAICRDAGAVVVDTPGEFVDAVATLRTGYGLGRRRIGVVADGGGHGVVAADTVIESGLEMADLSEATKQAMQPHLKHNAAANPVDLAGADGSMLWCFHGLVDAMLASDEVDAVVMSGYFGGYGAYHPESESAELEVVDAIAGSAAKHGKPVAIQSMEEPSGNRSIIRMKEIGLPVFPRIEQAVAALTRLDRPPLVTGGAAAPVPERALSARPAYPEARAALAELGIPFPEGALAASAAEAAEILTRVGAPAAMKAVAAELLHKTDAGGVVLGVSTPEVAAETFDAMLHRVTEASGIALDGIWVERMAEPGGVDLVLGAKRDPAFGPVLLVGVGGVFVEILDDVVLAPAPTDPVHLAGLIRTLRAFPLLAGARGQEPVALDAVARIACRLGDLLIAHPEIGEVEINPLRATGSGAIALDARIVPLH